jgi:hypothetical protein
MKPGILALINLFQRAQILSSPKEQEINAENTV